MKGARIDLAADATRATALRERVAETDRSHAMANSLFQIPLPSSSS